MLPYCLIQLQVDSIGGWIVLNRHYEPLGESRNPKPFDSYEKVPASGRIERLTVEQVELLSCDHIENIYVDEEGFVVNMGMLQLYKDGCLPEDDWDAYAKKLEILLDLPTMG